MGRNTFWCSTRLYTWAYLVYHFLSDLFLVISDTGFSNYADDNTIYDSANSIDEIISSLQKSAEKLFQCFSHNQIKRNTNK